MVKNGLDKSLDRGAGLGLGVGLWSGLGLTSELVLGARAGLANG